MVTCRTSNKVDDQEFNCDMDHAYVHYSASICTRESPIGPSEARHLAPERADSVDNKLEV
jgi:hypothetical protein